MECDVEFINYDGGTCFSVFDIPKGGQRGEKVRLMKL